MSRAASLPGAELFLKKCLFFLNKPLVPGSFAAWGRTFSQKMTFFLNKPLVRDVCAEQDVGNLKKCTSRISGTPVSRTRRRKSPKTALSGILGLMCAEQHVGNIKKCTCSNSGIPVPRTKRRTSQNMHFALRVLCLRNSA